MRYFFDTSALVKFYHEEEGTETVTALILNMGTEIFISELARLEFVSALQRKQREGELAVTRLEESVKIFNADLERFKIIPLNKAVVKQAEKLLMEEGASVSLRTLDALQLAIFVLIEGEDKVLVTADSRQEEAARNLQAEIINPSSQNGSGLELK